MPQITQRPQASSKSIYPQSKYFGKQDQNGTSQYIQKLDSLIDISTCIENMNLAHELETSNTKREINLGNISKNVMIVSGNDESAFAMSNTPTILLNQSIQNLISTSLTKPHKRCVSNIQSSGNIFLENPFTGTFDLKKSMELSNRKQKNNRSDVHQKKAIRSMQRNLLKNKASVKNILDSNL